MRKRNLTCKNCRRKGKCTESSRMYICTLFDYDGICWGKVERHEKRNKQSKNKICTV